MRKELILNRRLSFINEYINNGFNGTQAYALAYKVDIESARREASRLLSNVDVIGLLVDKLKDTDIEKIASKQYVLHQCEKLLTSGKQEQTRARIIELLAKIAQLTSDNTTVNTNIYSVDSAEQSIIKRRLVPDTANSQEV